MGSRVHSNRVTGTSLDTETTVDAAQRINLIADREFFNGVVRIFSGLNVDALRRTGSRAQKARRALNRSILFQRQAVPTPKRIRIRRPLVWILDGNGCLNTAGQPQLMQRMHKKVTPEAVSRDCEAANHLGKIEALPKRHLFDSFHSVRSTLRRRLMENLINL